MEKAVWITGASSGIGRDVVRLFVKEGINVIASARRKDNLNDLSEELKSFKGKIETAVCDVSLFSDVENCYNEFSGKYEIDSLINNAGITSFKPFEMNTIEEIDNIINTNLLGAIYSTNVVLPGMIKNNNGLIINMLSVITEKIFKNSSLYSASKTGLLAFSNVVREEVRKNNIRVINISPGATETEIWPEEMRDKFAHRMMKPDEIANLILYVYKQKGNMVIENITARPILGDL
jgi:short-subunit dehydrogenase